MSSLKDFFFRCQRSGNCCRVGTGRVWLSPDDAELMSKQLDVTADAFSNQFVVQVGDRYSLREKSDGSCVLLNGACECSVYENRPKQCRDFPNWEYLREREDRWEKAAGYCPGIQRLPDSAQIQSAFKALLEVYALTAKEIEGKAPCLHATDQRPASSIEVDYFLSKFRPTDQDCPALKNDTCTADNHRPLTCRQLPAAQAGKLIQSIQDIAENSGYPWSRAHWPRLLADRADAWTELTGKQDV